MLSWLSHEESKGLPEGFKEIILCIDGQIGFRICVHHMGPPSGKPQTAVREDPEKGSALDQQRLQATFEHHLNAQQIKPREPRRQTSWCQTGPALQNPQRTSRCRSTYGWAWTCTKPQSNTRTVHQGQIACAAMIRNATLQNGGSILWLEQSLNGIDYWRAKPQPTR